MRMRKNLFDLVTDDPALLARIRSKPFPPSREIAIHFTPRSGSSRVTEILQSTNSLGKANELFNPDVVRRIAHSLQARNLNEYIENARRKFASGGVFSFETTSFQIKAVFPSPRHFFKTFEGCSSFWLIREDIVAQAVSLSKKISTKIAHSANSTDEERTLAERNYDYDPVDIKKWLRNILYSETMSERFFDKFNVSPYRVSYEKLTKLDAEGVIDVFRGDIEVPSSESMAQPLRHKKIATPKNESFAETFRAQHSAFLSRVARKRQRTLERLAMST